MANSETEQDRQAWQAESINPRRNARRERGGGRQGPATQPTRVKVRYTEERKGKGQRQEVVRII